MTSKRKAEQQQPQQPGSTDKPPKSGADATASLALQTETIVFPGDTLSLRGSVVRLGPGLLQSGQEVVASRAGRLKQGSNARLWVDNAQKRYLPVAEDLVIGIVAEKHAENYKLDIGGPELHSLVYCRVVRSHRDMEAELSCISPHIKAEWVTGQTFFGGVLELCGSYVSYEVAVGMNGRVWIQCGSPLAAVLITNAIANSAHMSQQQTADMVRQLFASLS